MDVARRDSQAKRTRMVKDAARRLEASVAAHAVVDAFYRDLGFPELSKASVLSKVWQAEIRQVRDEASGALPRVDRRKRGQGGGGKGGKGAKGTKDVLSAKRAKGGKEGSATCPETSDDAGDVRIGRSDATSVVK